MIQPHSTSEGIFIGSPSGGLKITVVTFCKNQASGLERTVNSVLGQGYSNLEYIVVDGGSGDSSGALLARYEDRLQILRGDGRSASLNKALAQSSGDILTCLNAGSFYLPGTLQFVAEMFSQLSQVEWLTSLVTGVTDALGACIDLTRLPGVSREAFLDGLHLPGAGSPFLGYLSSASTFWRRSLWSKAGPFNESYNQAADYDLWGRFFRHNHWLYAASSLLACEPAQLQQPSFEQEALESLTRLRLDVNWRSGFKRKLAQLSRHPALRLLPGTAQSSIHRLCQYHARTIVRRRRASPDAYWAVSRLSYLQWTLSHWAPHTED